MKIEIEIANETYDLAQEWHEIEKGIFPPDYDNLPDPERYKIQDGHKIAWQRFILDHKAYFKPTTKKIRMFGIKDTWLIPTNIEYFKATIRLIQAVEKLKRASL